MQWWQWVLLWAALALLGTAYVGWRLWRLWPPLKALGREAADAQDRLTEIEARVRELEDQLRSVDDLAVLRSPAELREEYETLRSRRRAERDARRKARRPAWTDHVEW
ncbi:hypothetical protein [Flexivirga meconopsidis]|uniref:hypothetical protein n=1 Tax=Flexivirga meconopsidis TaxID=2977121 RepID=UPI002240142F|nr:hypothetical protein [Flexivirga meconopsidis]